MAKLRNVVVAGTFNCIHEGHRKLFGKAFQVGGTVFVGLTTDEFAQRLKGECRPFVQRKKELEAELAKWGPKFRVLAIDDEIGFAGSMPELDVIVASEETEANAKKVNEARKVNFLPELEVIVVPLVNDERGGKLSCRTLTGEGVKK